MMEAEFERKLRELDESKDYWEHDRIHLEEILEIVEEMKKEFGEVTHRTVRTPHGTEIKCIFFKNHGKAARAFEKWLGGNVEKK